MPSASNPRVSLLIPSYNYAEYLPDCLDSVLLQEYENMEVIVYDDASTDNSVEIIQDYFKKDPRFKTFMMFKENAGPMRGTNWAFTQVTGEFIAVLCTDDMLGPKFWESTLPYFEDKDVGVVRLRYAQFGPGILEPVLFPFLAFHSPLDLFEGNRIPCQSPFRTTMQKDIGLFDTNTFLSDWDFWIRGILKGWKWKDCYDTYYYRRVHPKSITNSKAHLLVEGARDYEYMGRKWAWLLKKYNIMMSLLNNPKTGKPYEASDGTN